MLNLHGCIEGIIDSYIFDMDQFIVRVIVPFDTLESAMSENRLSIQRNRSHCEVKWRVQDHKLLEIDHIDIRRDVKLFDQREKYEKYVIKAAIANYVKDLNLKISETIYKTFVEGIGDRYILSYGDVKLGMVCQGKKDNEFFVRFIPNEFIFRM